MKSARINFGLPNSEYIAEVNDSGEGISFRNQDTETEYIGGGGGESDSIIVHDTDGTLDITPAQLLTALSQCKRVVMYRDIEGDLQVIAEFNFLKQNGTAYTTHAIFFDHNDGGIHILNAPYGAVGIDTPFRFND